MVKPALDQSALTELLDALRSGGNDVDFIRETMQLVLQALIDLEATQVIGATRYECSDARATHRNGSRARLLSTKAGDVELAIPKLRSGSFFPALLEPRRRIDRALWAVVMADLVESLAEVGLIARPRLITAPPYIGRPLCTAYRPAGLTTWSRRIKRRTDVPRRKGHPPLCRGTPLP